MSHKMNQLVLFEFYLWGLFQHFIQKCRVQELYNSAIPWHSTNKNELVHFNEQEYHKYILQKDKTQMASHEWTYFSKTVNHLYCSVHKPLFSPFYSVTVKESTSRACFICMTRGNKGQMEHNCGLIFSHLNPLA